MLGSKAETALAALEADNAVDKVLLGEVGPEMVGYEDFGVGQLPEEEVADAEVATGADEQIGVGDAGSGEVVGDSDVGDIVGEDVAG